MTYLQAVAVAWKTSNRDARTLLQQGGIRRNGGDKVTDPAADYPVGTWLYRKDDARRVEQFDDLVVVFDPIGWEVTRWKGELLPPDNAARVARIDEWFERHGPLKWSGWDNGGLHAEWTRCPCPPDTITKPLVTDEVVAMIRGRRLPEVGD